MGTAGARLNPEKLSLSAGRVRGKKWTAAAVIAGGGTGTRMRSAIPKQFLELAGKPILFHSVDTVSTIEAVTRIVVVLPASCIEAASEILRPLASRREILFVAGGASRQESVLHGVEEAASAAPDLIMVHDAVRPLCDRDLMIRVLEAAWKKGRSNTRNPHDRHDPARIPFRPRSCDAAARGALCNPDTPGVSHRNPHILFETGAGGRIPRH